MIERMIQVSLVAVFSCWLVGCRKPAAPDNSAKATNTPPPAVETLARVHWSGKIKAAADTNLAGFMSIWNLAESTNLETQVISRLATAPWRLIPGAPALSNAPLELMVPLVRDLMDHEAFWEVRQTTNGPAAMALAVRLPAEKRNVWQTNVANVCEHLTSGKMTAGTNNGWVISKTEGTHVIDLRTEGEWVVWGWGREWNRFTDELCAQVATNGLPFLKNPTNYLLQAEVDLRRLSLAYGLGWDLPTQWPRVSINMAGNGEGIRTTGDLFFAKPPVINLEPWNIPTNLIHDPLVSFTGVQGLQALVSGLKSCSESDLGDPPKQLFIWAQSGTPFLSYALALTSDATNKIVKIADSLESKVNPWMTNKGMGYFRLDQSGKLLWAEVILMNPFLEPVKVEGDDALFFSMTGLQNSNHPAPTELFSQFQATNLVAYDWEITGERLQQWLHFGQLVRFALGRAQIPPESASFLLLKSLQHRTGNSGTIVQKKNDTTYVLVRNSAVGFTSAELVWLADWLESPDFPVGLNTFRGHVEPVRPPKKK